MFRDLEKKEDEIGKVQAQPAARLRILAPNSFGALHVADAVIAFAKQQPRLKLSLLLENTWFRQDDFSHRGLDMALRFAPIRKTALRAQPIAEIDWVVCAAPDYWRATGVRPNRVISHRTPACCTPTPFRTTTSGGSCAEGRRGRACNAAIYSNSAIRIAQAAAAARPRPLAPLRRRGRTRERSTRVPSCHAIACRAAPCLPSIRAAARRRPRCASLSTFSPNGCSRAHRVAGLGSIVGNDPRIAARTSWRA
jgi:DNA-binding transcriptional LysR family regulator